MHDEENEISLSLHLLLFYPTAEALRCLENPMYPTLFSLTLQNILKIYRQHDDCCVLVLK